MDISVSYYTECGIRSKNEDSVSVLESPQGVLAIVADGLGGHGNGEIASAKAISVLNDHLRSGEALDIDGFADAVCMANDAICSAGNGMKTTVAVLFLNDTEPFALHVGDSRIYQIRNGKIVFQSADHSIAQLAVLVGEISAEELRAHPDQNKLVRAIGNPKAPKIDITALTVLPGDNFLLCSDGFWGPVTEDEVLRTLADTETVEQWLSAMRGTARKDSRDNHTAIVIRVEPDPDRTL